MCQAVTEATKVATEATKAATVGRREERKEEMLLIEKT
jgi:hypothetical protein